MKIDYNPVQSTPFSARDKIKSRLWRGVWFLFYRPSPWFMYKYRCWLLRMFGGKVSYLSHPENSSFVEYPWNLTLKDYASLGERSWVYCLDKIEVDEKSCIGQGCQLITGSHNYRSEKFEMITAPIKIGKGCWLTSNVTVLMGVEIGDFSVIGCQSLLTSSIPSNKIVRGVPAEVVGERFCE